MKIQVLLFGILKDLINKNTIDLEFNKPITVIELKDLIKKSYSINSTDYVVAVNEVYQEGDFVLKNGDVIALIPPVSGG